MNESTIYNKEMIKVNLFAFTTFMLISSSNILAILLYFFTNVKLPNYDITASFFVLLLTIPSSIKYAMDLFKHIEEYAQSIALAKVEN